LYYSPKGPFTVTLPSGEKTTVSMYVPLMPDEGQACTLPGKIPGVSKHLCSSSTYQIMDRKENNCKIKLFDRKKISWLQSNFVVCFFR